MRAALDGVPAGSGGSRLLARSPRDLRAHRSIASPRSPVPSRALLFGSGYAANIGLLQAIVSPDDLIVSDERNHASLIDGIRLTKAATAIYPHQDLQALEAALSRPRKGRAVVDHRKRVQHGWRSDAARATCAQSPSGRALW